MVKTLTKIFEPSIIYHASNNVKQVELHKQGPSIGWDIISCKIVKLQGSAKQI